jgi:hypothetical protein
MSHARKKPLQNAGLGALLLALSLFTPFELKAQCPVVPAPPPWPMASGNPITSLMPMTIVEGSVTTLRVTGNNLLPSWTIKICAKPDTAVSFADTPAVTPDTASTSALQATIAAKTGSAGDYFVYVVTPGATYDTGKTLTIASADDNKYVTCAGPATHNKKSANLGCSFVPFSHETALEVFGKGVANRFMAIQVTVRNLNPSLEFLLQDIRVGQPGLIFSSYDKKIPRAVSEKEEQFSARAIIIRLTAAAASVMTGVAGFAGNEILQDAANIFAGPAQAALQNAIPNLSSAELTRMDDLGFSTTSTVISKSSAISVVAFIPTDTLDPLFKHWYAPQANSYATYQGKELKDLFQTLSVSVAGTHVQEVNPSQPTIKMFLTAGSSTLQLGDVRTITSSITIQGTGLDGVSQVQLSKSSDSATVLPAKLQPLASESTIDPNVAMLTVPSAVSASAGTYNISFVLNDGTIVKTGQSITIAPGPLALSVATGAIGDAVAITGVGFGTAKGVVTFSGVPANVTSWADRSISTTVPNGAPASSSVVVTVDSIPSTGVAFKVQ